MVAAAQRAAWPTGKLFETSINAAQDLGHHFSATIVEAQHCLTKEVLCISETALAGQMKAVLSLPNYKSKA